MSIGIDFILKATTDGFTAGMANVSNQVHDLKKSLREFDVGHGLKNLLGVGAVIEAFKTAIETAGELRKANDELGRSSSDSVLAIAGIGDAIGSAFKFAKESLVDVLGFFSRSGVALRQMFQDTNTAMEESARKAAMETGKAADNAEARWKAFRDSNAEKVGEMLKQIADKERQNKADMATGDEKVNALLVERMRLLNIESTMGENSQAQLKAKLALLENDKALAEAIKKANEESAKAAEQEEKFREGLFKASEAISDSMAEIRQEEAVAASAKKQAARDSLQAAQDEYVAQVRITEETKQQAEQKRVGALAQSQSMFLGLHDLSNVSTDVLQSSVNQRQSALDRAKQDYRFQGVGGSSFETANVAEIAAINSMRDELSFRSAFQRSYQQGGRQGALNQYTSEGRNPFGFDVALANMKSWGDSLSTSERAVVETSKQLTQLNTLVQSVFR